MKPGRKGEANRCGGSDIRPRWQAKAAQHGCHGLTADMHAPLGHPDENTPVTPQALPLSRLIGRPVLQHPRPQQIGPHGTISAATDRVFVHPA